MKRLKVQQASLCYRFYRNEGWTRSSVAAYVRHKEAINYVMPRYYDSAKDKSIEWQRGWYLPDVEEYLDCEYYAIHNLEIEKLVDMEKLNKEHDIIKFLMPR
jgi:hypothetical protein